MVVSADELGTEAPADDSNAKTRSETAMNDVPASSIRVVLVLQMKATANPGLTVTQSVDGVCKLSQIYVTSIPRTISAATRVGDSWTQAVLLYIRRPKVITTKTTQS